MVHRYSCTSREVDAAVKDTFLEAAQARLVAEGADLPEGALTALEPLRASRPALVGPRAPQSAPRPAHILGCGLDRHPDFPRTVRKS